MGLHHKGLSVRVCVQGLWHLGSVTAACLASLGHDVVGLDDNRDTIAGLNAGRAPLFEPRLDDLLGAGLENGNLSFTTDPAIALGDAEVVWIAYDTPVDNDDHADIEFVVSRVTASLAAMRQGAVVIVSSQMPVGSIKALEAHARAIGRPDLDFVCSPENLRLGNALNVFLKPDRIVLGIRGEAAREKLTQLLQPITERLEWMSVESAEMTKHAINAFLATSVTFANEIAAICEVVGADAKEVERGLKTEARIGPKAYLGPGGPFAGGTLARDIEYLGQASAAVHLATPLLSSVKVSNDAHKNWVRRKVQVLYGELAGVAVAVWGLTYKVGTSTLRRSQSVELCDWLIGQGARLHVHDPAATDLPASWAGVVTRHDSALAAVQGASILIVGTEWPDYRSELEKLPPADGEKLAVIDANRFLQAQARSLGLRYIAVGGQ
ncbi:UDP-glucose/GDP-mannose dehydrogenase family protein [Aurantimonas sp. HBX-1]|uniref:UDP-glucose dehydrogenase family protein n=1 Tax=Aurantimonas sp. HBX-1 TaxID=2906072 RepID=UPI001F467D63|nr:nucleotide sugar dehydrogenase [Aurantimonas sp. HBX-1]UIJ71060.1 nucleotide sugar dehydrogenase [Aurantimonas sp. HBX-1]